MADEKDFASLKASSEDEHANFSERENLKEKENSKPAKSFEELAKKSKEKFYRGKNVAELANVDTREFAKLVKSRARRAILRNYDKVEQFVKKCEENSSNNKPIKTHDRSLVVVPGMIGKNIGIHNGKEFVAVKIVEEMLGHRLGEFAMTRKIAKHTTVGKRAPKKP